MRKKASWHRAGRYRASPSTTYFEQDGSDVDLKDPAIKARIDKALPLAKKAKDQWATDFLASIGEGYDKYGRVTPKQYQWLKKIEHKHDPKRKQEAKQWEAGFTDDMRMKMRLLAEIQKEENKNNGNRYWADLVEKVLNDDTFIPTENQYRKFTENKYAKGKLEAYTGKAKFAKGDVVSPSSQYRGRINTNSFTAAIVIEANHKAPTSYAKGSKKYLILPHGATAAITVEERELKKYRAPKKKKGE